MGIWEGIMEKVALVIDNGSSFCRSGFAGEEKPRIVMKTASLPPIYHPNLWTKILLISILNMKRRREKSMDKSSFYAVNIQRSTIYCNLTVLIYSKVKVDLFIIFS
uniref:Uncharacterized protein n=1 Tax=Naja naja TaxID=35670 RepID=A0A8C6V7V8_NAJNA